MQRIITILTFLLFPAILFAQESHCGSTEMQNKLYENNPQLLIDQQKLDAFLQDWVATHPADLRDESLYIIPIVFHVIHDYGTENISDAQVRDAVRILNEDFRKLNADTSSIVSAFKDVAGDVQFEFRLANKTPAGTCSNGIEHIHSLQTNIGDDGSKLSGWPRGNYFNVWIVKSMEPGVAGYAYLPGSVSAPWFAGVDGVIILSNYVGSIGTGNYGTARALTHEIGHSMNMNHCWGSNNSPGVECGDDGVSDTPETKGWQSCNLNGSICNSPIIENVQNFMEYSFCSKMFTEQQGVLMRNLIALETAQRNNLWTSTNLIATGTDDTIETVCTPYVAIYSSPKMACTGSAVTFHDISWNGDADTRAWDFGDGITSTEKDPIITFNAPGWKTVSITLANEAGTVTKTFDKYILISDGGTGQYQPLYWESFENETTITNDWVVQNIEENSSKWDRVNFAGHNTSSSVRLNNFNNMNGDVDNLISPSVDLSAGGNTYLNFYYSCGAHATALDEIADQLTVFSSTNCGQTWLQRAYYKSADLANAGYYNYEYVPGSASPWKGKSILLPSSLYVPNVRFKFEYKTNGHGNNIYLDEINVSGNPVGIQDPYASTFTLAVNPNPINETSVIFITQKFSGNINLRVVDLEGRTVATIYDDFMSEGEHKINMGNNLNGRAGMFFLVANDGNSISRIKLVAE